MRWRTGATVLGAGALVTILAIAASVATQSGNWSFMRWSLPASLLLGVLFVRGTARGVSRPALALTAAAERMAEGDVEPPLPPVPDDDEIGHLAQVRERLRVARHRDAQCRQALRKVMAAQEEERRRIARVLEDDTAQALVAVGIGLELALEELPVTSSRWQLGLKPLISQSLAHLQRIIYDLRPSVLDDLGLAAATLWLAEEHRRRTGVTVRVENDGLVGRLPADIETALFRVIQEALINIERHACAETVLVRMSRGARGLSVEIEDDGRGFSLESFGVPTDAAGGSGLLGMRARVELLGGRFELISSPGAGTRIFVDVPLGIKAQEMSGGSGQGC